MTIQDFFAALRQRWRIILATLLVVLSVAAVVTMRIPHVYESSTRVYLLASGEDSQGNLYNMPGSEKETLLQVASSPVVLDEVREELGYDSEVPIQVTASTAGDTNLMDVTARSDDPQRAADIATAVPHVLSSVARNFANSLAMSGTTVEAQVISPAEVNRTPVEPNTTTNLLMGALAGLLLGVVFALIRQNLDTRVRNSRDLASLSERPLLSMIPERADDGAGHDLYLESDPFGPQSEAIRQLRTNLLFVDVTTGGHSFLVTSSLPGEGKTTTAVNLGLALADSGRKVLLIDADLRHPNVARTLGLEDSVGLTTVLVGAADPEDVIQRWAGTDLHIMAAGEIPPNPSELLGSTAMKQLFERLSDEFDFVLVDTPPVLPVADALVVSTLTSGSIMVVAANATRKRHLSEALRVLSTAEIEVGGFVLTKSAAQPTSYYYYHGGSSEKSTEHSSSRRGRKRRGNDRVRARRDKRAARQAPHVRQAAALRESRKASRDSWKPEAAQPTRKERSETTGSRQG